MVLYSRLYLLIIAAVGPGIFQPQSSLLEKLPLQSSWSITYIINYKCHCGCLNREGSFWILMAVLLGLDRQSSDVDLKCIKRTNPLQSNKQKQHMKPKSKAMKKEAPMVQNTNNQVQVPPNINSAPVSLNAQQQMVYNYQQGQQVPVQPNGLFSNVQQQAANLQQPATNPQQGFFQNQPVQQVQRAQLGVYGSRRPNQTAGNPTQLPAIFNDDEPFKENKESVKEIGQQPKVEVSLVAQRSQVKLGELTVLPAMCSVTSSGGSRTSVDLICVIDVSGSMSGEKIDLVKQTMKVLIQTLTPSDRLSIITFQSFGARICPLKAVTQQNMVMFSNYINQLFASGGTSIMSGMQLALKTIRDRKIPNKVTSVFLLSDGQDKGAEEQLKQALARQQNKDLGVFSIHSFGFGTDHDQDLMNKICTLKDGAFYFIKELSTLDQAFCNALGGIISLVASEIIIQVRCIAAGLVEGVKITKVFGDKWQKINQGEYKIKLTQLMSEISKEFVFQLTIPAIAGEVGDIVREHVILESILAAKGIQGQQMAGAASLSLTLINSHEQIAQINENVQVIENYMRVKAAEAIEENMKKAEANKYEQAQSGIDMMINSIQSNKKVRKEKMETLVKDLEVIREKCSKQEYQQQGRKWMVNAQNAHSNKANFQYCNAVQSQMVAERKSKKASYY